MFHLVAVTSVRADKLLFNSEDNKCHDSQLHQTTSLVFIVLTKRPLVAEITYRVFKGISQRVTQL